MEETKIKQDIIIRLLIEKLYGCLEARDGKIIFDKYNIENKDLLFLLREYDNEKFMAYTKMLLTQGGED